MNLNDSDGEKDDFEEIEKNVPITQQNKKTFGEKLESPKYQLEADFRRWALNNIKSYEDYLLNYGKIPAPQTNDYTPKYNDMWLWIEEENIMVDVVLVSDTYYFRAYTPWWAKKWVKNTIAVFKAVII